ncbi:MAG: FAD-dependent monooxygenase [Brachybacterium sp.]|uniref:FAD-dependent monooxygenase n=1 Tax=Brachybacterium sp. TaxID=1891286 RepID=UPI003F8E6766
MARSRAAARRGATVMSTPEPPLTETDVLIVGAGPTGVMAGLVLARRGVSALVIDPKPGPTRESRAIVVQARSMEILDQLGLAQHVLQDGQSAVAPACAAGETRPGSSSPPGSRDGPRSPAPRSSSRAAPRRCWARRSPRRVDRCCSGTG